MSGLIRWLIALGAATAPLLAYSCASPASLCEALKPGMHVFLGREIAVHHDRHAVEVTFAVQEMLWGPPATRQIQVSMYEGYRSTGELQFIGAVMLRGDRPSVHDCHGGFVLPANHDWLREFRRAIDRRIPAAVHLQLRDKGGADVFRARIVLSGPEGTFEVGDGLAQQLRSLHAVFDWLPQWLASFSIPAGTYTISTTEPNRTLDPDTRPVDLLPGSCPFVRIHLAATASIEGRVVSARGETVAGTMLYLRGWVSFTGRRQSSTHHSAFADPEGRFRFEGLSPGRYILLADGRKGSVTPYADPRVYYPGVDSWDAATPIDVTQSGPAGDIVLQLPDLGPPIRIRVEVVDSMSQPVRWSSVDIGEAIENGKSYRTHHAGVTDDRGSLTVMLRPALRYRISARREWGWRSAAVAIGPYPATDRVVLVLRE